MTQDEIVAMARDSGMELYGLGKNRARFVYHLEAFANLVAQEVRDRIMFGSRDDWVLAEREACAKLCEEYAIGLERNYSEIIADKIRARGQA
jgi:hypothetical protein